MNSLRLRLMVLMTLALLPLGLISIYQTNAVFQEARALSQASLMSRTVAAATQERELIREALGAAQGLGAAVLATDAEDCAQMMEQFVSDHPQFIFAGFVPADGMVECGSQQGRIVDVSDNPNFLAAIERQAPTVQISQRGAVTRRAVIIAGYPVMQAGTYLGYVAISIPHGVVVGALPEPDESGGLKLVTLNIEGTILSATNGTEAAASYLPAGMDTADLIRRAGQSFDAQTPAGEARFFSVTAVVEDSFVIVGSWPTTSATASNLLATTAGPIAFPVLMWFAGMGVAYFGLHALVLRPLGGLRSSMRRFALGERDAAALRLERPPDEFADAERAFQRMALILGEAEERQARDLHDKEILLREVNHRVKNNLQLIASIMNMQSRSARTAEAKAIVKGLQRRVSGLATLHRTLYTATDTTKVEAAELIETVTQDLSSVVQGLEITRKLDAVNLYPDQAVPLSMLLAEALTNAMKYAGKPPDGAARIHVSLSHRPEVHEAVLEVRNTLGAALAQNGAQNGQGAADSTGMGARLIQAFVSQLDAKAEVVETDDAYVFRVTFALQDFEPQPTPSGDTRDAA